MLQRVRGGLRLLFSIIAPFMIWYKCFKLSSSSRSSHVCTQATTLEGRRSHLTCIQRSLDCEPTRRTHKDDSQLVQQRCSHINVTAQKPLDFRPNRVAMKKSTCQALLLAPVHSVKMHASSPQHCQVWKAGLVSVTDTEVSPSLQLASYSKPRCTQAVRGIVMCKLHH